MAQGIKKIANQYLRNPKYTKEQRAVICEMLDTFISEHKDPILEGFFYLDLQDNELCKEGWIKAGKPSITKDNFVRFIEDPTRREYY